MFFKAAREKRKVKAADKAQLKFLDDIESFRAEVMHLIDKHGINPADPYIVSMMEQIPDIVREGMQGYTLAGLRLDEHVRWTDGLTMVITRPTHWCWTFPSTWLAEHFMPSLQARLDMVVVDTAGTHLHGGNHELCSIRIGGLDPERLNTSGHSIEYALGIVKHFTGVEFNWHDLVGAYRVTLICIDNQWVVHEQVLV